MSEQERLNWAIEYALRQGCLFPVSEPKLTAGVMAWRKWGALRYLHDAIAGATKAGILGSTLRPPEIPNE